MSAICPLERDCGVRFKPQNCDVCPLRVRGWRISAINLVISITWMCKPADHQSERSRLTIRLLQLKTHLPPPLHPLPSRARGVPIDLATPETKLHSVTHNRARPVISPGTLGTNWHCATSARSANKLVPRDEPAQALIRIKLESRACAGDRLKDCRHAKTTRRTTAVRKCRSFPVCARPGRAGLLDLEGRKQRVQPHARSAKGRSIYGFTARPISPCRNSSRLAIAAAANTALAKNAAAGPRRSHSTPKRMLATSSASPLAKLKMP